MAAHPYRRDFLRLAGLGSVLFASGLGYSAETSKDGKLREGIRMSKESDNKAVVGRWFTDFWGKTYNPSIVDELADPDMLLKYSLHAPRRGREDIKAFMADFRAAFQDLNFWGTADLIAEGDYVVGQWEGGGTHTGPAFKDFLIGGLPAATGRKMHFTGTTVLKVVNGKIAEEIGLDDGVTALTQLGLLKAA
jgi:predicted ester cyclase